MPVFMQEEGVGHMATIGDKKLSWGRGIHSETSLGMTPKAPANRAIARTKTSNAPAATAAITAAEPVVSTAGAVAPTTSARRRTSASSRIRMTPTGPVRLTPTEARIVEFIGRHEGRPCSKAQIAAALGRNEKTVGRLLSHMRREGILVSEPIYADNGAQLANAYRMVDDDHPADAADPADAAQKGV